MRWERLQESERKEKKEGRQRVVIEERTWRSSFLVRAAGSFPSSFTTSLDFPLPSLPCNSHDMQWNGMETERRKKRNDTGERRKKSALEKRRGRDRREGKSQADTSSFHSIPSISVCIQDSRKQRHEDRMQIEVRLWTQRKTKDSRIGNFWKAREHER